MTLRVNLPDSLAAQARTLAGREHITVDALLASEGDLKADIALSSKRIP